jgi:hypothetical protein
MDQVGLDPRSSGPKGRLVSPTTWPVGQALRWFSPGLDDHITKSVQKEYPSLQVGGGHEKWPIGHVDGQSGIHLLQINFVKSVEAPLCTYKSSPMAED